MNSDRSSVCTPTSGALCGISVLFFLLAALGYLRNQNNLLCADIMEVVEKVDCPLTNVTCKLYQQSIDSFIQLVNTTCKNGTEIIDQGFELFAKDDATNKLFCEGFAGVGALLLLAGVAYMAGRLFCTENILSKVSKWMKCCWQSEEPEEGLLSHDYSMTFHPPDNLSPSRRKFSLTG